MEDGRSMAGGTGSAAVRELLEDLALACRVLGGEGHEDMYLGHVAGRDPDGRGFWLKRSGIALDEVAGPSDFVLLDFDGNQLEGGGRRHLEWPIHAGIMRARPDVNATAHTHARSVQLLSATTEPVQLLVNESAIFAAGLPRYDRTCDLVLSQEQGAALADMLGAHRAILMANHGAAYAGGTVAEATVTALFLERAAASQITLASTGWTLAPAERQDAEVKASRQLSAEAIDSYWVYYRRRDSERPPIAAGTRPQPATSDSL